MSTGKITTKNKSCPWMTAKLYIKDRNNWYMILRRERIKKEKGLKYSSPFVEDEYLRRNNLVNKLKAEARKQYLNLKLEQVDSNPKKIVDFV